MPQNPVQVGGPGDEAFDEQLGDGITSIDGGGGVNTLNADWSSAATAVRGGEGLGPGFLTTPGSNLTFDNVQSLNLTTGQGDDYFYVYGSGLLVNYDGGGGANLFQAFFDDSLSDITVALDTAPGAITTVFGQGSTLTNVQRLFIFGGEGNDHLTGGDGNDGLGGGGGFNVLNGAGGDDDIQTYGGVDVVDGGSGTNHFRGNFAYDQADISFTLDPTPGSISTFFGQGTTVTNIQSIDVTTGPGDDTLAGAGGNDLFDGGAGNDVLTGGGGDDTLVGGSGDDTLDGSAGNDLAIYTGDRASYSVVTDASGVTTVQDLRPGSPDGTDILWGVELIQFIDQTLGQAPPPPSLALIASAPSTGLVEAGVGVAGTSSAVVNLTRVGGQSPTYELTGWSYVGNGLYGRSGTYGTVLLNQAADTLTYALDDAKAETNALAQGQGVNDTFTVTLFDNGVMASTQVSFAISGTNDAPVAGADVATTAYGATLTIATASLLANDTDPELDTLTLTAVGSAQHGTVQLLGGQAVFTPYAGFVGQAAFSYTVSDGAGGTATGQVTVNVAPSMGAAPAYIYGASLAGPQVYDFTGDSARHSLLVGAGDTTVYTGSGGSSVRLGAGDDVVVGGSGKDVITFGAGLGSITGGAGGDTFIVNKGDTADPALTGGRLDIITDFEGAGRPWSSSDDIIKFVGFSNAATLAYTGDVAGHSDQHIYRLTDGTYQAELIVEFAGAGSLLSRAASDFGFG